MQNQKSQTQKNTTTPISLHSLIQHIKMQSNTKINNLFQNLKENPSFIYLETEN